MANLIGAKPSELIFTSGATESINLALQGLAKLNPNGRRHIISQKTEHKAVLANLDYLSFQGYEISLLDVDEFGRIDLEELSTLMSEDTLLVAIMLANNEIGTIQPIAEIGELCRTYDATFFCDFSQGLGWYPIDVDRLQIDMAAMSSHKIYGPRGIGALYLRRFRPKTRISPILVGGGQEKGIRPGTLNIPAIVGFGKACEIYQHQSSVIRHQLQELRSRLYDQLKQAIPNLKLNGCPSQRHPANLNLAIPGIRGEELMEQLPNMVFSTGSACTTASAKSSHVLKAIGLTDDLAKSSFRLGISKYSNTNEIDLVAQQIIHAASKFLKNSKIDPV